MGGGKKCMYFQADVIESPAPWSATYDE